MEGRWQRVIDGVVAFTAAMYWAVDADSVSHRESKLSFLLSQTDAPLPQVEVRHQFW
jgi:hypothetical protein